ncbi:MAG: hypothetical protein SFT90_03020 [Rickettsiales bacterium]|nr:hypothetical protein [Rickettsiales bacterium]
MENFEEYTKEYTKEYLFADSVLECLSKQKELIGLIEDFSKQKNHLIQNSKSIGLSEVLEKDFLAERYHLELLKNQHKLFSTLNNLCTAHPLLTNSIKYVFKQATQAEQLSEKALRDAQTASGISASAKQQEFFNAEDKALKTPFYIWLFISIILFGATIIAPLYIVDFVFKFITLNEDLKPFLLISTKVVSTFLFASITFWASRMYRYYLNLRRIYKDKVILIKTYTAYLNSTEDEATKNLIKQKMVDVIFTPISVNAPGISNSDISKILEIHKK